MKRLFFVALVVLCFGGCSENQSEAKIITELKSRFAGYNSAYVSIADKARNNQVLACSYRFDGEIMSYFLMMANDSTFYVEHNDGARLSNAASGYDSWAEFSIGSPGFERYTRSERRAYIGTDILFFEPQAVSNSKQIRLSGDLQVTAFYDVEKLSDAFYDYFGEFGFEGKLDSLYSVFIVNNTDNSIRLEHFGTVNEKNVHYLIEVQNVNSVDEIVRPPFNELVRGRR
ncbi:MAG: hypothetical protein FWH05_06820 [Oscillospiraceae bacterium]|nr:hypothetical protein [Oscillospiraceae bacterium]